MADAKWKLIDEHDRANKYGISQADMYQLHAYSTKILPRTQQPEVWLIYPGHERFGAPLPCFEFETGGHLLRVLPFDLERGELVLKEQILQPHDSRRGLP